MFFSLGNGLILDNDTQGLDLESTDGVIELSNQFLLEFLIMLSLSTLIFYILLVKFRKSGLKVLFGFSLSFIYVSSIIEIFYFALEEDPISNVRQFNLLITAILLLILGIRFMFVFLLGKYDISTRNLGLLVAGLLAGRMIALYLDLGSLIAISIILIIYDIWNVFRGPLTRLVGKPTKVHNIIEEKDPMFQKAIIEQICDEGTPVYISTQYSVMTGLGDLFFFSALMYRSLMIWGLAGVIVTFTSIFIGLLLTIKLLQSISPLPGLPIPVTLALLSYLLLWIVV
ncbi:MAG: hypothetical protein GPJ54_09205 [Candidatus Heimdallarchaeota archaeon]|nr:hypothetical protein [Candidatus Heimdallarchaeota archaeon]